MTTSFFDSVRRAHLRLFIMISDDTPLDSAGETKRAPRVSRRSLLVGLGLGAAAMTVVKAGGSAGAEAGQLNEPGQALAPADRVSPPTTTTPGSTTPGSTTVPTTTSTVPASEDPPTADEPGPDGMIRFPIVVGADDDCYVLDSFGDPRGGGSRSHEGVDIMADRRLEVIAVVDGVLSKKYTDSGYCGGAGNGWTLTDEANDVVYKFFHMYAHADGLDVDDRVTAGQVIGYVGETGTSGVCSTQYNNYHLHFEYRPGDVARDSFALLQRPEHVTFAS